MPSFALASLVWVLQSLQLKEAYQKQVGSHWGWDQCSNSVALGGWSHYSARETEELLPSVQASSHWSHMENLGWGLLFSSG